eukprot:CAMPEP_0203805826 /NCGR_PEP_ID=MMETSP0100_2-20121128/14471_1 /ASSEMBLY_ACC=CAM_ASM_000210 /TAXON_ID=96639 /ORGANISM=" , Strain NY0313808BC1" /LENGTH=282 /DNA_ID=CAMNT_0050714429 /DNA_START=400 /DNA_END=1248 /DNA_ORIENTATION=-
MRKVFKGSKHSNGKHSSKDVEAVMKNLVSNATSSEIHKRQLYCGGIPNGIQANALKDFLNLVLEKYNLNEVLNGSTEAKATGGKGAAPVVGCKLSPDGSYAFVDFRTADQATAVMGLSHMIPCAGHVLKFGRPKSYNLAVGGSSLVNTDSHKWNGPMLNLPPLDLQGVDPAILIERLEASIHKRLTGETPSTKLRLENLVTAQLVNDREEMRGIESELREELETYGKVSRLEFPSNDEPSLGVVVEMNSVEDAKLVYEKMKGRTFDDREIKCSYATMEINKR